MIIGFSIVSLAGNKLGKKAFRGVFWFYLLFIGPELPAELYLYIFRLTIAFAWQAPSSILEGR